MTIERLQMTADLAIDNTDLRGWVNDSGITEAQIRAGFFDHARLWVYRVNYMDLSQGHEVIAYGRAGETKFTENGWTTEFRSLTQQLKQPISELYSLTCRVKFGSPECGKSFTWVSGSVTAVGAENDRQFTDSAAADPDHKYDLGVTEWLTGANAGAQVEIDT